MFVILLSREDLPTDGKPMRATRASPDFVTSNPSPGRPDFLSGSKSWACKIGSANNARRSGSLRTRYLASLAFSNPRWYLNELRQPDAVVCKDSMNALCGLVLLRPGHLLLNLGDLLELYICIFEDGQDTTRLEVRTR